MTKELLKKRLNEKAMLVYLQISQWTGRSKDSKVSSEVRKIKRAADDAGAWWTYIVPKLYLQKLERSVQRCRHIHDELTLPWSDGGQRILPAAMFMDYSKAMRAAKTEFEDEVEAFIKEYPTIVHQASKRLGSLLDTTKIPKVNEIRSKFAVRLEVFPLPDIADFRVDMTDKEFDEVKAQIKNSIIESTNKAMADVWGQLSELVGKIQETLSQPDKVFRDSLIDNLTDYCKLLPKFNLTDDNKLEDVRRDIVKQLIELKPNNLRENKKERKQAATAAKNVLEKIKGYTI